MDELIAKIVDDIITNGNPKSKEQLKNIVFFRPPSIRLSYTGYVILKKIYAVHKFPLTNLSNQDLINLYRQSKYPYYIGGTQIAMFDGEEAFAIVLSGGMREWLDGLC